jgi:hypothetical protein
MGQIKVNTLVIHTIEGEILDVLVGPDSVMLSQLKETQHWDTMLEESEQYTTKLKEFNVQTLSNYYKEFQHIDSLVLRVSYFPNKTFHYR